MPEQWSCGHCPLVVEIPDEQACRPAYNDTIMLIREHIWPRRQTRRSWPWPTKTLTLPPC
jgi:hypothetical protein